LLKFYYFSKDDLDGLNKIFVPRKDAGVEVHLTQQVRDEFIRNRESKIKDALTRFSNAKINIELPYFMRVYSEYNKIIKLRKKLQEKMKDVRKKVDEDVASQELIADKLIFDIFEKFDAVEVSQQIYEEARRRVDIGNPPGKSNSLGDAINWIMLIENVPEGQDLHIISEDGDFYSRLDEKKIHPFLEMEWKEKKSSDIHIYRSIGEFLDGHFDGTAFPYDKRENELIEDLATSGSFASTHSTIAELESYGYFSLEEVKRLLGAAISNNQVSWVLGDDDLLEFYHRVAIPRREEIRDKKLKSILDRVAGLDLF